MSRCGVPRDHDYRPIRVEAYRTIVECSRCGQRQWWFVHESRMDEDQYQGMVNWEIQEQARYRVDEPVVRVS